MADDYKLYASKKALKELPEGAAERIPAIANRNVVLIHATDMDREMQAILKERGAPAVKNFPHDLSDPATGKFYENLEQKYGPFRTEAVTRVIAKHNPELSHLFSQDDLEDFSASLTDGAGGTADTQILDNGQEFCVITNGISGLNAHRQFELEAGGFSTKKDVGSTKAWNIRTDYHEADHCNPTFAGGLEAEVRADLVAKREMSIQNPNSKDYKKTDKASIAARDLGISPTQSVIQGNHDTGPYLRDPQSAQSEDFLNLKTGQVEGKMLEYIAKDISADSTKPPSEEKLNEARHLAQTDPQLRYTAIRKIDHDKVFAEGSREDKYVKNFLQSHKEYDATAVPQKAGAGYQPPQNPEPFASVQPAISAPPMPAPR